MLIDEDPLGQVKLQLHDAIYRLRFFSNSLIHILSLSNLHNNVASIQKNRGDKSHRVIVALERQVKCVRLFKVAVLNLHVIKMKPEIKLII